jgi:hypothetical protein
MTARKQDSSQQNQSTTKERAIATPMVFTPPSRDEEEFLKSIEQASEGYDPKVIVGGPRNSAA